MLFLFICVVMVGFVLFYCLVLSCRRCCIYYCLWIHIQTHIHTRARVLLFIGNKCFIHNFFSLLLTVADHFRFNSLAVTNSQGTVWIRTEREREKWCEREIKWTQYNNNNLMTRPKQQEKYWILRVNAHIFNGSPTEW